MKSEEIVIASILPSRVDLLNYCLLRLQPRHFLDENLRSIFEILRKYHEITSAVLPLHMLEKVLQASKWEAARILAVEQTFKELTAAQSGAPDARWAVEQLRQDAAHRDTDAALAEAKEILDVGWSHKFKTGGEVLKGHEAARAYVYRQLHDIERAVDGEAVPEGDMRLEGKKALDEYAKKASGQVLSGVKTGLKCVDNTVGGLMNGELILLVAFTGQGKSQLVTQIAWYVAVELGLDVFFATSETIRAQVMRRIWARHSRLPQFETPAGINAKDLKNGTLTKQHEKVFENVLEDMRTNPKYGQLHIAQLPPQASVAHVDMRLREFGRTAEHPALCVVDYLALLRGARSRQSKREEYDEIINDAKHMATTFQNGRGIPVLSPWAVSRTAYEKALTTHSYGMASLAETSVAEKSSDMILGLIREEDNVKNAWLQFMKVRDGDLPPTAELDIDFRSTFAKDKQQYAVFGAASSMDVDPLKHLDL